MESLYAGIDLHSNNSQLGIIDQDNKRKFQKKLPNKQDVILAQLEPFRKNAH